MRAEAELAPTPFLAGQELSTAILTYRNISEALTRSYASKCSTDDTVDSAQMSDCLPPTARMAVESQIWGSTTTVKGQL
jgi:hypothetical protein